MGGRLGATGRGPPGAATLATTGAAAKRGGGGCGAAEGAGPPGTLAVGLPGSGTGPAAGAQRSFTGGAAAAAACSGCPLGIRLTGAAAEALMEEDAARGQGVAAWRRAPRRPAASRAGDAQALRRPPARSRKHMVAPLRRLPRTWARPAHPPQPAAGGSERGREGERGRAEGERGRAEGGPTPPAHPTAAAPGPAGPGPTAPQSPPGHGASVAAVSIEPCGRHAGGRLVSPVPAEKVGGTPTLGRRGVHPGRPGTRLRGSAGKATLASPRCGTRVPPQRSAGRRLLSQHRVLRAQQSPEPAGRALLIPPACASSPAVSEGCRWPWGFL